MGVLGIPGPAELGGKGIQTGAAMANSLMNNLVAPVLADVANKFQQKAMEREMKLDEAVNWAANELVGGISQGFNWLSQLSDIVLATQEGSYFEGPGMMESLARKGAPRSG